MTDVMTAPAVPAPEQAHAALVSFAYTIAALTIAQGPSDGQSWASEAAREVAAHVHATLTIDDVAALEEDFEGPAALALSVLYREIIYIDRLYRDLTREVFPGVNVPFVDSAVFPDITPPPFMEPVGQDDVERIDVVYGSIEKLLKKLPPWLKKILDVAMELLKLSRGIAG